MSNNSTYSRLASNSAIYFLSNIARALVPFALLPVLTRYLTPAEYGTVAMFQILSSALVFVVGVSVHGAANRKYYDTDVSHDDLACYIGSCIQILLATTFLALLAVLAFGSTLSAWLGLTQSWMLLAVLASSATFVINLRLGQWQIREAAAQYGLFQFLSSLASMLLSILLVTVLSRGASGSIEAQVWAVSVFSVLAIASLVRDKLLTFSWRPDFINEALHFGIPLIPNAVGLIILSAADRMIIKQQLGLADAGIYMVALQITMGMNIVFDAVNKAYVPWLYEHLSRNDEEKKRRIVLATYGYFAIALAIAAAAFVVGPFLVKLLAGHDYNDAGNVVGWLAIGQAFGGMYLMVTNYIFYSRRTGLLAVVTIGSGLCNLALLLVLVKSFGLIGAAWSFAIAMGLRFVFTWAVAQHRHPMPWLSFARPFSLPK